MKKLNSLSKLGINVVISMLSLVTIYDIVNSDKAMALTLTTGLTVNNGGDYNLTLESADGSRFTINITGIKQFTSAENKAKLIEGKFNNQSDWRADRNGNTLTFWHRDKSGTFVKVKKFVDPNDSTGEVDTITSLYGGTFGFGIDEGLLASGYDDSGNQSFASIETTLGYATLLINSGDTSEFIVSSLFDNLKNDGVDISSISTTSFQLMDTSVNGFMRFQITDNNLNYSFDGISAQSNVVPEPLTIFGAGTAIGFGTGFKRKLAKAKKK